MANEIFISYSRRDNTTGKPKAPALVASLHKMLVETFEREGDDEITISRDVIRIERSNQFLPLLEEMVDKAEILVVVHSRNWEKSEWCQWELERFSNKFRELGETDERIKERIFPLWVQDFDRETVKEWLRGQDGYHLFQHEFGKLVPFYNADLGRPNLVDEWYELTGGVGRDLLSKARLRFGLPKQEKSGEHQKEIRQPNEKHWNGTTIFFAFPAADMRDAYGRVVQEMTRRGYRVVPDPTIAVPHTEHELTKIVDDGLKEAAISVHMLGDSRGFQPERVSRSESGANVYPLAHLQLEAARRRRQSGGESDTDNFRRVIWAPRTSPDAMENAESRDPFEVLRYHLQIEDEDDQSGHEQGDKVVGDTHTRFIQMLIDLLENMKRNPGTKPFEMGEDVNLYVDHHDLDADAALDIAMQLHELNVSVVLPPLDGPYEDRLRDRKAQLKSCSGFMLCWKDAADTWVRAQMSELRNWQAFERSDPFAFRAVLALPPSGKSKDRYTKLPPPGTVDEVIDATALEPLTADALRPLLQFLEEGGK